jgi:sec-independent protein translocase protein TatA
MGFGGISPGSLVLILLIILVLFGTKKLRNIGEDLGHALKSFRKGLNTAEKNLEDNLDDSLKDNKDV